MKQKITNLILIQVFCSTVLFAQIPNGDFENWTNIGGWFSNPDDWSTNNSQILTTFVSPDSDAYSGNLAMHLYNFGLIRPVASAKFSSSNNLTSINAMVKLKLIINDTVSIIVREFYNGAAVDSGMWVGTSDILNYTSVSIPISQNNNLVDTVEIEIKGGNQTNLIFEGTDFLVDHLTLNTTNVSETFAVGDLQLYPNPSSNLIYIQFKKGVTPGQFAIFDSKGNRVQQFKLYLLTLHQSGRYQLDISTLSYGIYFIQINVGAETRNYKFIKQEY